MVVRGKVGNSQHFPTNLHILLDEAEKGGHAHIVSWCAKGNSFKIHDQEALVPLLAKYFRQTKFKSFLRQLQSYGFHRTTRGCDKGIVSHPYFVRGRRSLCFRMTRKPTGAAAAQEAMTRQLTNSSGSIVPTVLLRDTIMPLRKTQSAPIGFNKNPLQGKSIQAGAFTDLSKLKNDAFNFGQGIAMGEIGSNHLQKMNSFKADKVPSSFHPSRRRTQSATSLLYASSNSNHHHHNNTMNQIRRASDPAILLSSQQREDIEKCSEIDYRAISPPLGERRLPRNGFLLSIQESTSVPNQVPSSQQQQQVSFQVQPDNRQEPLPLHAMHQHEPQGLVHQQVIQVQQTSGQQNTNQVQIHQLQYQHQAQAPQHQVCVQYHSEPDHRTYPQHVTCSKYEVQPPQQLHQGQPPEVNVSNQDRSDKVYSQQQVAEKIKQAREDMEKHYREQLYLQQGQPARQQVVYHAAQLVQHQKVCEHPVKQEEEQQQQPYHKVPCSNTSSNCASPVQSSMPHPHKTSTMYASVPPSNNFEMSFSTSEFSNNRNGTAPLCAPTSGSESSNAIGNGSSSSFSVAISGPMLHRLPPPSTVVKAMPPTPRVSMNAYSKRSFELQPIDIHNMQSNHHSQELDYQQRVVVPPSHATQPPEHSIEPVPADSAHDTTIDEGTVDFLLQNGNGGCEEWDMHADEVAEGLDYYGFSNTPIVADTATEVSSTESSSSCLQQQQQGMDPMPIHYHHHSNPIPVANAPQYNRRQ